MSKLVMPRLTPRKRKPYIRKRQPFPLDRAIMMYTIYSLAETGKRLGYDPMTVQRQLKKAGIRRRSCGHAGHLQLLSQRAEAV